MAILCMSLVTEQGSCFPYMEKMKPFEPPATFPAQTFRFLLLYRETMVT